MLKKLAVKFFLFFFICLFIEGCSTSPDDASMHSLTRQNSQISQKNKNSRQYTKHITSNSAQNPENKELSASSDDAIWSDSLSGNADNYDKTSATPDGNIWDEIRSSMQLPDYSDRPEVQNEIAWFKDNQKYLDRVLSRSSTYIYYIYEQTQLRGLPSELALLPVIESAYNPLAYSKSGASGLWQMMPGTASILGVKTNWWFDGRRDLASSTKAALDYLTYMHELFDGDWLLAIGGYNCGEHAIQWAQDYNAHLNMPTDFWSLRLSSQTMSYVPKLLAVAAIIRDPAKYGLTLVPINNAPYIKPVKLDMQIDLNQAAKLADVSLETLRQLNPGYIRWATDPEGPNVLMLPADKAESFVAKLNSMSDNERVVWHEHTVNDAQTIDDLAQQYNTSAEAIKQINFLQTDKLFPKQKLLIPENFHGSVGSSVVKQGRNLARENLPPPPMPIQKPAKGQHMYIYKVTAKDNIYSLAKRFNSSVQAIKQENHLKTNTISVGQIIKIPSKKNVVSVHSVKVSNTYKVTQSSSTVHKKNHRGTASKVSKKTVASHNKKNIKNSSKSA